MISAFLALCACVLMSAAWFMLWQSAIRTGSTDPSPRGTFLLIAGITAQIGLLVWIQDRQILPSFDFKTASLIIGLTMVGSIMLLSIFPRFHALQLLVLPVNIAALIFAMASPNTNALHQQNIGLYGGGMALHIILSILAYSFISLAFLQACLLFFQDRQIKKHNLDGALRFVPPLQTMEQMMFDLVLVGIVLLSGAILTGVIFIDDIMAQHLAHKTVFSFLSLGIFTTLYVGRKLRGWRGSKAIAWCFAGFIALMLAYFGTKFVLEILLNQS